MAVPEMPPPSLIFDYASIDAEDPVDMVFFIATASLRHVYHTTLLLSDADPSSLSSLTKKKKKRT